MSGLFQDEPPPAADAAPPPAADAAPPPAAEAAPPPAAEAAPPQDGPGLFGDALPAAPASAAAYRVLARKYRPQHFDDLIGQEAMVRILRRAFALGRVAHAFMLTGVRGVGKTTTARIIARAFNCIGPDGQGGPTPDPCGVCPNCVAILADRHPDVVEMDAASNTGVDDVREIIDATRFRPMQARAKVFIVDEVHMLSRNAFNALLKTLEEPPPHVKFIFATTEIRKVPVTVLSRCQRFDLRRVSAAELSAHFARIAAAEAIAIEAEAVALIARAADGSVRDGLSLLDQAIAQGTEPGGAEAGGGTIDAARVADMLGLADRGALFDLLEALMAGEPAAALAITDRAHERGADLGVLIADLLDLVHTLTRLKSVPGLRDDAELPEAERSRGAAMADRLSVPVLGRLWQMLLKGLAEVEAAPDRRAAAEMVLIRLCHVADLPPPGELVRRLSAAPGGAPVSIAPSGGGGGGARAAVGGGPVRADALPAPPPAPAGPRLAGLRDVVTLAQERREALLAARLLHSVHLVRFAPPVIELRPEADAPRDLASRLAALLLVATGTRWTIALSTAPGAPTLAEQDEAVVAARREDAAQHPLVRAILDAFPGARIETIEAPAVVLPDMAAQMAPDMPEFAPPDAEPADAELADTDETDPQDKEWQE
ncbi:MAG TPA: DNA polymerase III subunit gamma/tau [Acetobacteraceae bacterium]|nr:DNA polymerase III subunit gamma/tau [Acetobacteraceae bacterium]